MFDKDNREQALRMACETFLADYDGTPTLDNLDRTIATASVWEPLEGTPDEAAAAITGKRDLKIPAGSFPAYFLRIKYSSTGKA